MARRTLIIPSVHLSIQKRRVGVGGLEPPTSASQTRRAGRLRYTPADKSIIRTMLKRQDCTGSQKYQITGFIIIIITVFLSACQPGMPSQPQPEGYENTPTISDLISPTINQTQTALSPEPATTSTPTSPPEHCQSPSGKLNQANIFSDHLGDELHFLVYVPPCYDEHKEERYPVLYLLHGLLFDHYQWVDLGLVTELDRLIAEKTIPPFIVVFPQEARFNPPQTSTFSNALVFDLIPWIDLHHRTLPEKEFRALGGLSRGAAWSIHIGFSYPDLFSQVGAHSLPLFEADGANLNTWLSQTPEDDLPVFFIDIGRSDPERQSAQHFANRLDEHKIPHDWYLFTGGHNNEYWSSHLHIYLGWYARNW